MLMLDLSCSPPRAWDVASISAQAAAKHLLHTNFGMLYAFIQRYPRYVRVALAFFAERAATDFGDYLCASPFWDVPTTHDIGVPGNPSFKLATSWLV